MERFTDVGRLLSVSGQADDLCAEQPVATGAGGW